MPSGMGDKRLVIAAISSAIVLWSSGVVALVELARVCFAAFRASIRPAGGGEPAVAPCEGSTDGPAAVVGVFLAVLRNLCHVHKAVIHCLSPCVDQSPENNQLRGTQKNPPRAVFTQNLQAERYTQILQNKTDK
jgi:hypothetical protein